MPHMFKRSALMCGCALAVLLLFITPLCFAQTQTRIRPRVNPKLLEEIAGRFEFRLEGGVQIIVFSIENGVLMAGLEGEAPVALSPLKGEEMTFVSSPPEGPEYHYRFQRDADGKINTCLGSIPSMGIEAEGTRIKEEG